MRKSEFYDLIKSIPKAEIHIHEEAVLSKNTLKKVYRRSYGKHMTLKEYNELFNYKDLNGFLDSFIKIQTCFTNIEDLKLLFADFAEYLEENNITYCETFFSPTAHLKKGWDFNKMIGLVSESIEKIQKEQKRTVKIIIDVSRSFGLENAMQNLDYILKSKNPYIIGIGLGGSETKGAAKDFKAVFDKAKKNGLHCVVHAGEVCPPSSIWDSINYLNTERIGHGLTAKDDPELIKFLAEHQIPVEVCPTSNIFVKQIISNIKDHPLRLFYDSGILTTINTDDPTFFKVSLIDEYWNAYSKLNFTLPEIKDLIKYSFKASFISEEEKEKWYKTIDKKWNEWFKNHPQETK